MPNPEIDVLWHGEWIIRELMETGCYHVPHEKMHHLELLVGELERIRKMRVARWQQRERAARFKKMARRREADRGNAAVRSLMRKAQAQSPID